MLQIKLQKTTMESFYQGIKILNFKYPSLLSKSILNFDTEISIENRIIKKTEIVYINEFSKLSDFLSLNKNSILVKKIIDLLAQKELINNEIITKILDQINEWIGINYLDLNDGDELKIINLIFEVAKDIYLNQDIFLFLLKNNVWTQKMFFVLDNVSWLKINELYQYLNEHNFLIICNDFRNYITNYKEIELVCIINDKYENVDLVDSTKLINYLELKLNSPIDYKNLNSIMTDTSSKLSSDLFFYILNITNK